MNKTHTLTPVARTVSSLTSITGETNFSSITFQLLSLIMVAALTVSVTTNARAVCQTPQFANPVVLTVTRPVAVAVGDYNRDGKVDLAILKDVTSGTFRGVVEIYVGNGSGGFTSTGIQYSAVQTNDYDIANGDFNNDGFLDLVVTGGPTSQFVAAVLLGNGSGAFGAPTNFSLGDTPNAVKVGDFNNDNNLDILSVNTGGNSVSILPGQGNGSFNAAFTYAVQSFPLDVITGDFNNDGKLDFISVNRDSDTVSIKLGNGNFTFSNPNPATISFPDPENLVQGDFNRDGKLDFAVTNRFNSTSSVSVRLGTGSGVFNAPSGDPFSVGAFPRYPVSADFNSDGFLDIATDNDGTSGSGNLSVILNNGLGGFGSAFTYTIESNSSGHLYAVDYNQNGATDLVIVKALNENKVVLLTNTCLPANRTLFDFDGDGKAEVSAFRPSNGVWYLQQSTAGFTGVTFGLGTDKITPADYDGDGKTDIAVYRNGTWYLQRSQLGFTGIAFGAANDVPVPADYDGDGRADLAVFRPSNGGWYIQRSQSGLTGTLFGQNGDKPVPADYDGDGKADIAVTRSGNWYIQRSQLGFTDILFGTPDDKPTPADYDGDGKADVAVFRPSNGTWYLQQSSAGFTGIAFGAGTDLPVAADYDGDGKADVAVFRNGMWYINRSTQGFYGIAFGASTDLPIPNAFDR